MSLKVSDHAVVRYMERVMGLDLADIRKKLASKEIQTAHKNLGDGRFPIEDGNGMRAVVKHNVVITVMK